MSPRDSQACLRSEDWKTEKGHSTMASQIIYYLKPTTFASATKQHSTSTTQKMLPVDRRRGFSKDGSGTCTILVHCNFTNPTYLVTVLSPTRIEREAKTRRYNPTNIKASIDLVWARPLGIGRLGLTIPPTETAFLGELNWIEFNFQCQFNNSIVSQCDTLYKTGMMFVVLGPCRTVR